MLAVEKNSGIIPFFAIEIEGKINEVKMCFLKFYIHHLITSPERRWRDNYKTFLSFRKSGFGKVLVKTSVASVWQDNIVGLLYKSLLGFWCSDILHWYAMFWIYILMNISFLYLIAFDKFNGKILNNVDTKLIYFSLFDSNI